MNTYEEFKHALLTRNPTGRNDFYLWHLVGAVPDEWCVRILKELKDHR